MKNCKFISVFLICILYFIPFEAFSQQIDENTQSINQYFQLNNSASLGSEAISSGLNNNSQMNVVSLNQVGNENEIDIKNNSNNSQKVTQIGNQNDYNFINYYNSNPSNFNILQQGESNSLQIYGQNSIIENMTIIQNSSFKTLIIKNY